MKKKVVEKIKKKKTSLKEGASFEQTNIDQLLNNELQEEIVEEVVQDELKKDSVQETLDENVEKNKTIDEGKTEIVDEGESDQKKKIDEMEQSVSKQKSKKSKKTSLLFFLLNILVVGGILTYQLLNEEWVSITNINLRVEHMLIAILLLCCVLAIDALLIGYLLKQTTGKWKLGLSYKVGQIGRYYDCITPMATGGQPFQINYLKSRGVPVHTSLSVPIAKYVFGQIAWVVVSLACLIISWVDKSYGTFVSITSIVGFVLSSAVLFATLFLSICKSFGRKLVVRTLKFLHKIKIVKNYEKQYEKITKTVSEFQDVMKQYAKSPKDFFFMSILSILKNVLVYSMPFFIVKFFGANIENEMFLRLFVMSCLVDLSSSFFPLPGGTGMNEVSFSAAFAVVVGQTDILVWVLIAWRFFTYYFYLIQGLCVISYDMAYGNRKYRWQVRKENLAEESAVFKQTQINRFRAERAKRRNK